MQLESPGICSCGHPRSFHRAYPLGNAPMCRGMACSCSGFNHDPSAPETPQTWDDVRTEAAHREHNDLAQRAYLAVITGYHARMGLQMPDEHDIKAMNRLAVAYVNGWEAYRGD